MDEGMFGQFYRIIQILSEVCEKSTGDDVTFPMTIMVEGENGKGHCIPIPNHAAPRIAASVGKEMMRDLLRYPNVDEMFTKEQLFELETMTNRLSSHLRDVPSLTRN